MMPIALSSRIDSITVTMFTMGILSTLNAGCGDKDTAPTNASPTITIINPVDGDTWTESQPQQLLAQVVDADHLATDLSVRWSIDGEVVCDWTPPDAGGNATCSVVAAVDMAQIRAEVQDTEGASTLKEVSVFVASTKAPLVNILTPLNGSTFYSDQEIPVSATIEDDDNALNELTISWTASNVGALEVLPPDAEGLVSDTITLPEGAYTLTLDVTDPTEKQDTSAVDITVIGPNEAPICEIVQPTSGDFSVAGSSVTFAGTFSDPNIEPSDLAVTWTSDKDGELFAGMGDATGSSTFTTDEMSQNTHQVTLTVTDEMGLQCTDTIQYSIGTPPSIILQQPYANTLINEGDEQVFSALVSDTEQSGPELMVEWSSDVNGTLYMGPAESSGISQFETDSLSFGAHIITATVTDLDGLYATANVNMTVNAIPSQPSVIISPDPATTSDALEAIASGSTDFDGTQVTYQYEWFKNSVLSPTHTGATIPATATLKDENWMVRVTPTDGIINGPSVETDLTVSNTPPVMTSVSVAPTSPTTLDNITCSYSASDVDVADTNLTYTFDWFINSASVSGATNVLNGPFSQGDVVTCRVTPNDGFDLGNFMEASTTVINTAPIVHSVTLSPTSTYTNDVLTATVDSTDLDGDTLTHTWIWYVDGTAVQSTSNTSTTNTLDGVIHFDRDQTVHVEVTADDGFTIDTETSAGQTILNTPPSAFNAFIDPINPVVGVDDITCMVQSNDIDGDTVSLSYTWTIDGNSTGYASNVIPTSEIADGETWLCTIIATDGTDDSSPVTASVTVGANVEAAVGQNTCAAASFGTDGNYDLASCLSDLTLTAGESTDSTGYTLQMGSHYVYTPE